MVEPSEAEGGHHYSSEARTAVLESYLDYRLVRTHMREVERLWD